MSRGTILYIGGFRLPDGNAAAHRVLGVAKILRSLGYNVVLIGTSDRRPGMRVEETKSVVQGFESWTIPYPTSVAEWLEYVTSIKPFCRIADNYEKLDAVIFYNFPAAALYQGIRYCRSRSARHISDCTEWYESPRRTSPRAMVKAIDTALRMRVLQKKTDGVICVSTYLQRYYARHTATVLVPPTVDLEEAKWIAARTLPKQNDCTVFAYAGSPGDSKDRLSTVIEALARLDDSLEYRFKIAGVSCAEYVAGASHSHSALERLGDRVQFLGRLSHADSLALIGSSDYMVFIRECSRANSAGFPTKFVESVACGTPVVTTPCSDLALYVDDGQSGFFVQEDGSDLSSVLVSLIDKQSAASCRVDRQRFDYRTYLEPMETFLRAIESEGASDG